MFWPYIAGFVTVFFSIYSSHSLILSSVSGQSNAHSMHFIDGPHAYGFSSEYFDLNNMIHAINRWLSCTLIIGGFERHQWRAEKQTNCFDSSAVHLHAIKAAGYQSAFCRRLCIATEQQPLHLIHMMYYDVFRAQSIAHSSPQVNTIVSAMIECQPRYISIMQMNTERKKCTSAEQKHTHIYIQEKSA